MEVRILGPIEVLENGRQLDLGGGRPRALLAILVLNRNQVVSSDRLIDELWGERPPQTASKGLQNLVARLRKSLGLALDGALQTHSNGYVLRLADDAVDAHRFERLAREGRQLLEEAPGRAEVRLREGLSLWRGSALADFSYERFAQSEIARLDELRLGAIEDRIEARLATGDADDVVAELEALGAAHPERERLRGQLMLALYRSGRQTEALDAYRAFRSRLRTEFGLEPSAALKQLEQAILRHDPALGPVRRLPTTGRRKRRRLGVVAAALALVAAVVPALLRDGRTVPVVVPDALVKIDAETNKIVDVIRVGKDPGQIALVGRYVFVANQQLGTLSRVDRTTGETTTSGRLDASGSIDAADSRSLWVVSVARDKASRVDAESLDTLEELPLPRGSNLLLSLVEAGGGSLWVTEYSPPVVSRWDLASARRVWRYRLADAEYPLEVSFGLGAAWIALWSSDQLLRVEGATGRRTEIAVGSGPRDPAVGFRSVWVAMAQDGTVWRIDPRSGKPRAVVDVGNVPWGVAANRSAVWVTNNCDGTVSRIDPETNQVVASVRLGFHPQWIAADDDYVWVGLSDLASGAPAAGPASLALPSCG